MDQTIINFVFGITSAALIGFVAWIFRSILELKQKTSEIEINYKDRFAQVNLNMADMRAEMNLKFEELKNYVTQENITTRHAIRDAIHQMQLKLSEEFMSVEDHEKICKYSKDGK